MTGLNYRRLAEASMHPLQLKILHTMHDTHGRRWSATELAKHHKESLGTVAYHVVQLRNAGLIKLVKQTPRRGAVEKHYVLTARAFQR